LNAVSLSKRRSFGKSRPSSPPFWKISTGPGHKTRGFDKRNHS
jgi:hypothetical protein